MDDNDYVIKSRTTIRFLFLSFNLSPHNLMPALNQMSASNSQLQFQKQHQTSSMAPPLPLPRPIQMQTHTQAPLFISSNPTNPFGDNFAQLNDNEIFGLEFDRIRQQNASNNLQTGSTS